MSAEAELAMRRCDELGAISAYAHQLERVYLSPEHARANALVAGWMTDAGLRSWTDAAGNVCARLEGARPGLPALLLGSHLDTVPDAGRYDGPLGVVMALAVVDRLRHSASELPFAIEVVGFADEEGTRFGRALLGSRALAGTWDDAWWTLSDGSGTTLRDAFVAFGLDPDAVGTAGRRRADLVGYLEAHIEQGPHLEARDRALGVVSSIAGARRFALTILGEARHAGGTPYDRRRDALCGASEVVLETERLAKHTGTIATVGRMQVRNGGVNVVPGRVDLSLDLRAEYDAERDKVWHQITDAIDSICAIRGLRFKYVETHNASAVACRPYLTSAVTRGIAATRPGQPMVLFSRAGHDGMAMADVTDIGMLFVRCHDGISHHPDESVLVEDVALGIDAFARAVGFLAAERRP